MMIPPSAAIAPPLNPVPAPRGRNGSPYSQAIFTIPETCSVVCGKYNRIRLVFENRERVAFVDEEFGFIGNDGVFSDNAPKFFNDFRAHYLLRSLTVSISCFTRSS